MSFFVCICSTVILGSSLWWQNVSTPGQPYSRNSVQQSSALYGRQTSNRYLRKCVCMCGSLELCPRANWSSHRRVRSHRTRNTQNPFRLSTYAERKSVRILIEVFACCMNGQYFVLRAQLWHKFFPLCFVQICFWFFLWRRGTLPFVVWKTSERSH